MRINKYFTDRGLCSRRQADKFIREGRIKINGKVAILGDQISENDNITLDDSPTAIENSKVYIMYNKPVGVTCTTELNVTRNIVAEIKHPKRIFPIGRLDKDSTGLIFLTNDGDIVNQILRAQFNHEKEYIVQVDRPMDAKFIIKMSSGVNIGDHMTMPCKVKAVNPKSFSIILTEGKNRQIRRMCETLGYQVRSLQRIRIMNVKLGSLAQGHWQNIPQQELDQIKNSIDKSLN